MNIDAWASFQGEYEHASSSGVQAVGLQVGQGQKMLTPVAEEETTPLSPVTSAR